MRTRILTVLGVLLVAIFTSQMEMAAARGVRKVAGAPDAATQQLQDGVPSRPERRGTSAPAVGEGGSCDIFWCYGK
jgi:hypothetical protein